MNTEEHGHLDYINLPKIMVYFIALILAIYVGCELGFGGWIPTYTVNAGILEGNDAANTAFLFWGGLTIGRFSAIFLTSKINTKRYIELNL